MKNLSNYQTKKFAGQSFCNILETQPWNIHDVKAQKRSIKANYKNFRIKRYAIFFVIYLQLVLHQLQNFLQPFSEKLLTAIVGTIHSQLSYCFLNIPHCSFVLKENSIPEMQFLKLHGCKRSKFTPTYFTSSQLSCIILKHQRKYFKRSNH